MSKDVEVGNKVYMGNCQQFIDYRQRGVRDEVREVGGVRLWDF